MPAFRSLAVVAACALALAGCWREEAKTGASSAESHAPGTTLAAAPGSCASYVAGTPGVVRTFCDGPAVVKVRVGSVDHTLKGGTCAVTAGMFTLNLGVVSSPDLGGPKPDYVGLTVPVTNGPFSNAVLSVTLKGKGYALTGNSGTLNGGSGTFEGTSAGGDTKVSGAFTC
jgi:hypothetical protein